MTSHSPPDHIPQRTPRRWLRPMLLLLVLLAAYVIGRTTDLGALIESSRAWILELGYVGVLLFVLLYAVVAVLPIPGLVSYLTIAAGGLFGPAIGIAAVSLASTMGAAGGFAIARWGARDFVQARLAKHPAFLRLDALTEQHGAMIVAVTRLVPIFSYTLLNYAFGLTLVPFRTYLLWSWLCMLPGTVLYVVGADAVTQILTEGRISWIAVAILLVTVLILTFIVRHARRVLHAASNPDSSPPV